MSEDTHAIDKAAKALYDACPTVKPSWDQLGQVTREVWRERVTAAPSVGVDTQSLPVQKGQGALF